MGTYRISRNIEASLIQYIIDQLVTDKWLNINVEKTFARIYKDARGSDTKKPYICIRVSDTTHEAVEIGSNSTYRIPLVFIDIFGVDDGNRLDLKDYLVSILKNGFNYYEYNISNGAVQSKVKNGKIRVLSIADTPVDFNINKNELDMVDRYRHLLTLTIDLGKVEE